MPARGEKNKLTVKSGERTIHNIKMDYIKGDI